jgi:hypothetical protein
MALFFYLELYRYQLGKKVQKKKRNKKNYIK